MCSNIPKPIDFIKADAGARAAANKLIQPLRELCSVARSQDGFHGANESIMPLKRIEFAGRPRVGVESQARQLIGEST